MDKAADAFRTISEVAEELGIQQHVLRFWETKFSQIKPLKRGGGRRYYRHDDVDLLRGIRYLLYGQGYTIKGVQRIIKEHGPKAVIAAWIELSQDEANAAAALPQPFDAVSEGGGHELDETSEVSERLFASVRSFDEDDEADDAGDRTSSRIEAAAPAVRRPDFQPRPDVSIMRGGLPGSKSGRPGILPLRSLGGASATPSNTPEAADSDLGAPTVGLSATDRAELSALMQNLAECRRILDTAGRT